MGGPFIISTTILKSEILEEWERIPSALKICRLLAPYIFMNWLSFEEEGENSHSASHALYDGMGSMTYLKAIEAGVDIIDTFPGAFCPSVFTACGGSRF